MNVTVSLKICVTRGQARLGRLSSRNAARKSHFGSKELDVLLRRLCSLSVGWSILPRPKERNPHAPDGSKKGRGSVKGNGKGTKPSRTEPTDQYPMLKDLKKLNDQKNLNRLNYSTSANV